MDEVGLDGGAGTKDGTALGGGDGTTIDDGRSALPFEGGAKESEKPSCALSGTLFSLFGLIIAAEGTLCASEKDEAVAVEGVLVAVAC